MRLMVVLAFTGGWTLGAFLLDSRTSGGGALIYGSIIVAPIIGIWVYEGFDWLLHGLLKGAFGGSGGETAFAHSEGEVLVQHAKYEEAAEWFASKHESDPADWKAQARLVEILAEHFHDAEKLAIARNRLVKAAGVPEGLWGRTAIDLGGYWEEIGQQNRALTVYRLIIQKYPESFDAEDARIRLAAIEGVEPQGV